ncbi:MAG: response regulator [Cyanobacteria bacterium J06639_1]
MKILLVEDDETISRALSSALESHRYLVDTAFDGEAGWDYADTLDYDLILLDVMLPKLDGISLCRRLRDRGNTTPILLLTAQDTSTSKIMGLDAGADDYVVKPYDLDELLARIRALLRRGSNALPPVIEWRQLRLDPSTCEVTFGDRPLSLTRKEYSILELFMRNSRRIFSQSVILDLLWSFEESPGENTVRAHVKSLRQKLKKAGAPTDLIETVYGLGYRLRIPIDDAEAKPVAASPSAAKPASEAAPRSAASDPPNSAREERAAPVSAPASPVPASAEVPRVNPELVDIWLETRSQILTRMAAVRRAQEALRSGSLSDEVRQLAIQNAHVLVGSLGILGLMQGSLAARDIEMLLKQKSTLDAADVENIAGWLREFDRIVALPTDAPAESDVAAPELDTLADRPLVLVVDRDREFTDALAGEAARWGMTLEVIDELAIARERLEALMPAAVVVDICWLDDTEAGFDLLATAASHPPIAPIALADLDRLSDRVRVARLGGKGFLQKPVTPQQVFEAIERAIEPSVSSASRVLVVDDDPAVLQSVRALLEPWGMDVSLLTDPEQFWTTLSDIRPDLLVLDVDLPRFSGIELCQVVQNDPQWSDLPVLMLADRADAETIHQLFAAGAADYARKPIVSPELVARVLARLERSHLLRTVAETDRATGIPNRRRSTRELNQLLTLAARQKRPFSLAIANVRGLDDDCGDRVLHQVGEHLRQVFRQEDIVARWTKTAFVLGLYDMTERNGIKRLYKALDRFILPRDLRATEPQTVLSCTVGIAQYAQERSDVRSLYRAAKAEMRQAAERPLGST